MNKYNIYIICLYFGILFNGCSLIKLETTADPLPVNALNARIMTHEFAKTLIKYIDETADSIIAVSADPKIQINALRWKINAVATCRNAAFQADPILSLVDTWIFMLQMEKFFKSGAGKDAFGPQQANALNTIHILVSNIDTIAINVITRDKYLEHKKFVEYYVDNYPLEDFSFTRKSVMAVWHDFTGIPDSIAVETVGSLPQTVSDLTSRLTHFSNELPRQAEWNTKLIILENELDSLNIGRNLDSLAIMIENLNTLIKASPEYLDSALVQLTPLFDRIDRKWSLTLRILQKEREILLNALQLERQAVMADLDQISQNVAQILMDSVRQLISDILIYIIIILIVILGIPFTMGLLVGRVLKAKK
jgi:hypothetical protein